MSRLLGGLMQKAQEIKSKVQEVREDLKNQQVTAESDEGAVKVVSNCDKGLVSISIDESLLTDRTALEKVLLKTANEALSKAGEIQKEAAQKAMKEAGLFLPGLF
jgi:DNA-binding YbaB/EbfC family protein